MNFLSLKTNSRVYQFALEDIYYIKTIKEHKIEVVTIDSVSYTHLDVYKRQIYI